MAAEKTPWFGLLYSIGVRSVKPFEIQVESLGHASEFIDAVEKDELDAVRDWLTMGIPTETKDPGGERETALIVAANKGHVGIAMLLLRSGADINAVDKDNETALIDASKSCHLGVVQALLAHTVKPDLSVRDNNDETALDKAIDRRCQAVERALRDAGASD